MNNETPLGTLKGRSENLRDLTPEEYNGLFKTKDMYLTAFLIARGLELFGLEAYQTTKSFINNKTKEPQSKVNNLVYFYFKEKAVIDRIHLNYHNPNRTSHNVNAESFRQAILMVRSIITDPPL